MFSLFARKNPGRDLARLGQRQQRQRIREVCDEMRREMGMPPVKWGRLH